MTSPLVIDGEPVASEVERRSLVRSKNHALIAAQELESCPASPPLLREARALLKAGDLGVPFLRRLIESETVRLRPTAFPSEASFSALDYRNCRQRGGLTTGTGLLAQEKSPGEQPQANDVLVRQLEGQRVKRILAERPQFLRDRPSVGFDEGHARIAPERQESPYNPSHARSIPQATRREFGVACASVPE